MTARLMRSYMIIENMMFVMCNALGINLYIKETTTTNDTRYHPSNPGMAGVESGDHLQL